MFARASYIVAVIVFAGLAAFAQPEYPQPVSEYVEQTGPATMTFLSYPKYYRDAENQLTEVDTTFRVSSDPNWDYEVTTGIWALRVRKDGTYQAEHEGDIFTYRLSDLGIGRGDGFQSLKLGEPDWSRFSVLGDSIRWADVFPDVDFEVRYIHDIMKVDVIVKQNLLKEIVTRYTDDYLSAKFDIPSVLIRSEAKQNGITRDLYAKAFDIDQPLTFEREDKIIHKMRPVAAYNEEEDATVGGKQTWQLNQDGSGQAELSISLSDINKVPEGDLVIDPSTTFRESTYQVQDTLVTNYDSALHGSDTLVNLRRADRFIVGFDTTSLIGRTVTKATLGLHLGDNLLSQTRNFRAYKITSSWMEDYAKYNIRGYSGSYYYYWNTNGGDFESQNFVSRPRAVSTSTEYEPIEIDVTQIFKSHHSVSSSVGTYFNGFLIKREDDTASDSNYIELYTTDHTNTDYKPKLVVEYAATQFGVDPGNGYDTASNGSVNSRLANVYQDNYNLVRFFADDVTVTANFVSKLGANDKAILVFPASALRETVNGKTLFADKVYNNLTDSTINNAILNEKVFGIEIGNEESTGVWEDIPKDPSVFWFGSPQAGKNFADFYIAAYQKIELLKANNPTSSGWQNLKVLSSGTANVSYPLNFTFMSINPDVGFGSSAAFLEGFIQEVRLQSNNTNDRMPDIITIHNYSMEGSSTYSPEFRAEVVYAPPVVVNGELDRIEYFDRLDRLFDVCHDNGIVPNFAQTEYGYSPTSGFDAAPGNTSESVQAIYYLRESLITATMQPKPGIGFAYDLYFHHPWDYNGTEDYGFYRKPIVVPGVGDRRVISAVAEKLHNQDYVNYPSLSFNSSSRDVSIWKSVERFLTSETGYENHYALCAWSPNNDGIMWGAIWQYQHNYNYSSITGASRDFVISGDWSPLSPDPDKRLTAQRYIFTTTVQYPWTGLWTSVGSTISGSYNSSTGKTTFVIPNVTENPTFIKFTSATYPWN